MTADTEKALLEWAKVLAEWFKFQRSAPNIQPEARAYLATLEPKPEPKRGVEELLALVLSGLEDIPAARDEYTVTKEALRLYREERERADRVANRLRFWYTSRDHGMLVNAATGEKVALVHLADELGCRDG